MKWFSDIVAEVIICSAKDIPAWDPSFVIPNRTNAQRIRPEGSQDIVFDSLENRNVPPTTGLRASKQRRSNKSRLLIYFLKNGRDSWVERVDCAGRFVS